MFFCEIGPISILSIIESIDVMLKPEQKGPFWIFYILFMTKVKDDIITCVHEVQYACEYPTMPLRKENCDQKKGYYQLALSSSGKHVYHFNTIVMFLSNGIVCC